MLRERVRSLTLLLLPLLLLLVLLVTACAKAPPRTEPELEVVPPDAWSVDGVSRSPIDSEWWASFDDPTLNELVGLAIERNWDLRAALARVERAQAQARIAGADLKPTVDVGLNGARQKINFRGFDFGGGSGPGGGGSDVISNTFTGYDLSLRVNWEIDLWGRLRAAASAAAADVQASESDLRGARQSIAGLTAKLWFSIAEAREQVDLAESSVESFRGVADKIRDRYERGVRPPIDLRLALSNLTAAEASLQARRRQLDALVRQLEVLLGDYPDRDLEAHYAVEQLLPVPPPVPAGLPAELVARRPDLVSAERRLAAADRRLVSARRALYPRLALTGSGGSSTLALGDLLDGDFSVWSLAANLTQPIFQGGRLRANIAGSAATRDEALALYAGSVLQAYAEVESRLAAEGFLRRREGHLAESARQLIAAEKLSGERYRIGVGTYLELLESQTRAFVTQSELLSVRRQRLENRVDLHLALGGGFEYEDDTAQDDGETPSGTGDDAPGTDTTHDERSPVATAES
jgi:NodT family efflux transporter outer membrane factor (OMF) lipoprotein